MYIKRGGENLAPLQLIGPSFGPPIFRSSPNEFGFHASSKNTRGLPCATGCVNKTMEWNMLSRSPAVNSRACTEFVLGQR